MSDCGGPCQTADLLRMRMGGCASPTVFVAIKSRRQHMDSYGVGWIGPDTAPSCGKGIVDRTWYVQKKSMYANETCC